MTGKVWLVGAGPGDRGLLTLKGLDVLSGAEVVVYDALIGSEVLTLIPETAEKINVGKRAGNHRMAQEDINRTLLEEAQKGRNVVRLKGGDPFVFGRGGEELELLAKNNIPYEVVPGVTSAFAVPAYNGIPVTHRDFTSSVHIITGHRRKDRDCDIDFEALVKTKGTLIFLMGLSSLEGLMDSLLAAGMDPDMPAAVLEKGTTARQRRVVATVSTLKREADLAEMEAPAIIVVGEVCRLAESFAWAEKRPLAGRKILVTRPKELISGLASRLRGMGAEVLELPAIETVPITPNPALEKCLRGERAGTEFAEHPEAGTVPVRPELKPDKCRQQSEPQERFPWDWLVFTSPTGVRVFMKEFLAVSDVRALWGTRIAVIGEGSARELRKYGLREDFMPSVYDGETLGRELAEKIRAERASAPAETAEGKSSSADSASGDSGPAITGGTAFAATESKITGGTASAPSETDVRILIPRASIGNRELIDELSKPGGVYIIDIPTYDTIYKDSGTVDLRAQIQGGEVDYAVFTSASTVRGFAAAMEGIDLSEVRAVCIGRQTKAAADSCGMKTRMAERAALDALAEAVVQAASHNW